MSVESCLFFGILFTKAWVAGDVSTEAESVVVVNYTGVHSENKTCGNRTETAVYSLERVILTTL